MRNQDIREAITNAGLRYWMVAEALGCTDGTLSRRLRKELPQGEKDLIFAIIWELQGGESNGVD